MSPSLFKITYCDINLLELVVAVRLGKCYLHAIFIDGTLKIGMPAVKSGAHINFKIGRDTNFVAKTAE